MDKLKALKRAVKLPYIKVKYKEDDPATGAKKGDIIPIAYRFWNAVPVTKRGNLELVEGPETMQELKETEMLSVQELHNKLGESLGEVEEEIEEDGKKKKVRKKKS